MALKDYIDAAKVIIQTSGNRTAEEMATINQGRTLEFMLMAISRFKQLINQYPDVALQIVNEFKQDPSFGVLMQLLGPQA